MISSSLYCISCSSKSPTPIFQESTTIVKLSFHSHTWRTRLRSSHHKREDTYRSRLETEENSRFKKSRLILASPRPSPSPLFAPTSDAKRPFPPTLSPKHGFSPVTRRSFGGHAFPLESPNNQDVTEALPPSEGEQRRAEAVRRGGLPDLNSWQRRHALLRLWPYLAPHAALVARAWACTLVSVGCLVLIVPRAGNLSSLLSQGDVHALPSRAAVVFALVLVRAVAQFGQDAWLWEAALRLTQALREAIFAHVQTLDLGAFEGRGSAPAMGDLAYRITEEADDAGATVHALLHAMVPSVVQLVAMMGRMVLLSPLLTVTTLAVVPCMSLVIAVMGKRLRQMSRAGQDSVAGISAYLNEVLPCALLVKAHGAEAWEARRFSALAATDAHARLAKKRLKSLVPTAITAAYAATVLALLTGATLAVSHGRITGGGVVSFLTSLVLLIEPIQAVGGAYNEMKQGEPAVERLLELLSLQPRVRERPDARVLREVRGEVELRGVSFRYEESGPDILRDVNVVVRAGETVVVVGPSGGGKTTLLKLLLRLYDPNQGQVLLDGHDVREFTLTSLRRKIGIIPQETVLFTGTVAENIAYGELPESVHMAAVERAARLANAHDFISALPHGYHTHLGERATALSGGQRQRLAIARAVYHEPSILIMDEATSALDNQSEQVVKDALENLMATRTVLMVAHRLQRVRDGTRILFLEGGRVVEDGTHGKLISTDSRYAALYKHQLGGMVASL